MNSRRKSNHLPFFTPSGCIRIGSCLESKPQDRRQTSRYPYRRRPCQGLHRHGLRTINGSPVVSDRLYKRVWQAIEQLNYLPNIHARTLVSGRSRLLGIIVENITNPFFPELIQSFEEVAVAHGYEILVSSTNSDPAVLAAACAACWNARSTAWPS